MNKVMAALMLLLISGCVASSTFTPRFTKNYGESQTHGGDCDIVFVDGAIELDEARQAKILTLAEEIKRDRALPAYWDSYVEVQLCGGSDNRPLRLLRFEHISRLLQAQGVVGTDIKGSFSPECVCKVGTDTGVHLALSGR